MFSSIKDKFLKNVPLFTSSEEVEKLKPIDLNAGSAILKHYEDAWQSLHAINEANGAKAEEIANTITAINAKVAKDKEDLGLMVHILESNLPRNISTCINRVEELFEQFNRVEEELLGLEDLIDTINFEAMKKQHRFHMEQYKVRKSRSLQDVEKTLRDEYVKSVEQYDIKRKKELQERQQVFQEAFRNDIETFKSSGTIPKLDLPKKQPSALLEEIQVDFDESELNKFLDEGSDQ